MVYFICMPLVVCYIFFDVLDLDGSNFSRVLTSVDQPIIVAEAAAIVELNDFHETEVPAARLPPLLTDLSRIFSRLRLTGFRRDDSGRGIGYRVGLPRNSLAEPSPYH